MYVNILAGCSHVSPICYPATCIRQLSHLIYRMSKNFQVSNDSSHGNNTFPETLNNLQKQWFCKWLSHICVHLGCLSVSYFWDGSISALSKIRVPQTPMVSYGSDTPISLHRCYRTTTTSPGQAARRHGRTRAPDVEVTHIPNHSNGYLQKWWI